MNNIICLTRVTPKGKLIKRWIYLSKVLPLMDKKLWKEVSQEEHTCSDAFKFNSYCERHLWRFDVNFIEFLFYPE